jgi:hypothetical protein
MKDLKLIIACVQLEIMRLRSQNNWFRSGFIKLFRY